MNTISRIAAGVLAAFSMTVASAQSVTLTFEAPDLAAHAPSFVSGSSLVGVDYNGYTFNLPPVPFNGAVPPSGGIPAGVTGGPIYVLPHGGTGDPYATGATPGQNISGLPPSSFLNPSSGYATWGFSATDGGGFYLGGFDLCNCSAVYMQITANDVAHTSYNLVFDPSALTPAATSPGFTHWDLPAAFSSLELKNVQFSGLVGVDDDGPYSNFAIDNINLSRSPIVAAVPEPSSYAMMIAGLGVLAVAARRRKSKAQA